MPTGYTAGILDGEIKTFKQFATLCVRAFGAAIHMKDDSLSVKYEERVPSDYHKNRLKEDREKMVYTFSITDEQIIQNRLKSLQESKEYHEKHLAKTLKNKKILEDLLHQAQNYKADKDYENIKIFMIEQLSETLKYDGNTSYDENELINLEIQINKKINPSELRNEMLDEINKDIEYHEAEYEKELNRCEESNKWVKNFFNSLPNE